MTINKTEIATVVADRAGITKKQATEAIDIALHEIMNGVAAGTTVQLHGFGTFTPKTRAARTARNPRTGESVQVAASTAVGFKSAKAFKDILA